MDTRRTFLAALGAGVVLAKDAPHRIDVHCHFSPLSYLDAMRTSRLLASQTSDWTIAKAIEDMDQAGVATAIVSITTPGVSVLEKDAARRVARECNEYAARLKMDHPGRFGSFIVLPVPDMDGCLKEVEYGLDVLKAEGIGLLTSYTDKWLGDPVFSPLFEELNRRKAVVYTHPTSANCCRNILPGVSDATIEYGTDTTRAIARMVFTGASIRYPDMRMIFSHAGGTMPFLIERFVNLAKTAQYAKQLPQGFLAEATKFYYDTAQASNATAMAALKKVIPMSQVVFGTDFPFRTSAEHVKALKECGVFNPKELRGIDRENAQKLLPKVA